MVHIYTLENIQGFIDSSPNGYSHYLTESVKQLVKTLDETVIDLSPIGDSNHPRIYDNSAGGGKRQNHISGGNGSYKKRHMQNSPHDTIESWIAVRNFKPTKMEVKEGIEKNLSEIRVVLNKITNKNYEAQMETILGLIDKNIESLDDDGGDEYKQSMMHKIGDFIFEISSTNKFYSELYADLYKVLVDRYSIYTDILQSYLKSYKEISILPYVESNVNYDAYCEYTKTNERRRSTIHFFILLMKRCILDSSYMMEFARSYLDKVQENIDNASFVNELDEYTELIFIIMTVGKEFLQKESGYNDLYKELETISGYKMKEKLGFSSRSLFKYRDLIKMLKTN